MSSGHELDRFLAAQDSGDTYTRALAELHAGQKTGHWMWFVFPQLAGLGRSPTAQRYAISSVDEARAYVEHPVLGARLRECATALLSVEDSSAREILGSIDALKLRSSMTLFERADPQEALWGEVLERYFAGERDELTWRLLG